VRYALISDIHSNLLALERVLEDIEKEGVDLLVCAGDLVGYGPFPNEVIKEMRDRDAICIAGNHDRAVINLEPEGMNPHAATAMWWTAKRLGEGELDYLRKLKARSTLNLSGVVAGLFHGSPRNDDEYIYEEGATTELLELAKADIIISGHTHVPYIKRTQMGVLVNPGAIGQPRDGDPRASYVIYEERGTRFQLRRLEYDVESTVQAISDAGLPSFLGARLLSGI